MKSFEEKLLRDWRDDAEIASSCRSIYEFLSVSSNHKNHFTYSDLKKISNSKSDEKLSQALHYLSAPGRSVLRKVFFLFDGEDLIEYDSREMFKIYKDGAFAHPKSGELISDLDQIQIAFSVGKRMEQNLTDGANE